MYCRGQSLSLSLQKQLIFEGEFRLFCLLPFTSQTKSDMRLWMFLLCHQHGQDIILLQENVIHHKETGLFSPMNKHGSTQVVLLELHASAEQLPLG